MTWEAKIWGRTRLITRNAACELHEIEAVKGGYCSIHRHQTKWNGFQVLSGSLLIREWYVVDRGGRLVEIEKATILNAGEYKSVRPGVKHQFEAIEDCHANELYWAEYSPDDIERDTVGGMRHFDV